jgi:hypothetical protein
MSDTITSTEDKVPENRIRRWASRLGLQLMRSRAKRWSVDDHGQYRLVDVSTNAIVMGERFDCELGEIEGYLEATEADLRGL